MQYITKQYRIEALVLDRKMPAIVRQKIDARGSAACDIQANHSRAEHALQVVRDEAIAATDIEDIGPRRQHSGDFERHIVCSPDLAASAHALEATLYSCA